jgi:Holliday junction resolvase RusA-like endonuclease
MRYIIPGDPVPLQRARTTPGQSRPWDPQKKIKLQFGHLISLQNKLKIFYEGPLELDIVFYMRHSNKSLEGHYHTSVPDLSNMVKFIEDVAQGILYKNDCTICSITTRKIYSQQPRTEFTIRELKYT